MPDWELSWIKTALKTEARAQDASLHNKMKQHDIQQRLNLLFGPDSQEKKQDEADDNE